MPRVVKGPDGVIRRFPDDATDDEIRAALESSPAAAAPNDGALARLGRMLSSTGYAAGNAVVGGGKGAVNTVSGLGDLARMIPGVSALDRVMTPIQINTTPSNAAQTMGYYGEQIGEFFTPTGMVGRLGKIAEIVKAAGLTAAQTGGDPTATGLSALLTGIVPGAKMARRAASALETGAEKNIAQALGATTRDLKKEAAELAPEMLKRGIRGSREAMRDQSAEMVESVGKRIGAEVQAATAAGKSVSQDVIRGNIQLAKDALMEKLGSGKRSVVPGYEQVAAQLDALEQYVAKLPTDIPFDQAHRLKMKWDSIVDAAGLFGAKGMASAADKSKASAFRSAADAFRDMLNSGSTTLADLNAEFGFWKSLNKITEATTLRTQAQTGGLIRAGTAAAGAASGFASGDSMADSLQRGALGGVIGANIVTLIQSPAWRTTVTAPMKQQLAKALASGNGRTVADTFGRIVASLPAQLRPAFTP